MCKGEFSAVIVGISVCEAGGSGHEELKKCPPISPAICDLWILVKENPDRKINAAMSAGKRDYCFSSETPNKLVSPFTFLFLLELKMKLK